MYTEDESLLAYWEKNPDLDQEVVGRDLCDHVVSLLDEFGYYEKYLIAVQVCLPVVCSDMTMAYSPHFWVTVSEHYVSEKEAFSFMDTCAPVWGDMRNEWAASPFVSQVRRNGELYHVGALVDYEVYGDIAPVIEICAALQVYNQPLLKCLMDELSTLWQKTKIRRVRMAA